MSLLDDTLGGVFFACIVSSIFYGITCLQTIYYFMNCKGDGKILKGLVATISVLDSLHMALVLHFGYIELVKSFGDLEKLAFVTWSLPVAVLTNVVNDLLVRLFFSRRVWILSGRNTTVITFLGLIISVSLALSLFSDVQTFHVSKKGTSQTEWAVFSSSGTTTLADLTIAAALCFYLARSRGNYYKGTRRLITSLLQYTIQTGLFATLWSTGSLISFGLKPNSDLSLIFYLPQPKIYANALLASLNARENLREKSRISENTTHSIRNNDGLSSIAFNNPTHHTQFELDSVKVSGRNAVATEDDDVRSLPSLCCSFISFL
ncbi:hypothetical protein SCHPADRAFT_898684 [Schizopora paradoxa]|uniref:DUF6534 domain-containing protein n=1 Tax=Schizopora paradoxa TaxID=27342 RepID=A0A0H2SRL7_9AGAM|nr:hypothetical protein SCHPADRAFT_898684 [Schizopora paradoxa]